jgi:polyhydroxyalkanoate synthesis regulator phasin
MAFQLPKIDLADAKTRIILIFSGIVGFVLLIYLVVTFFSSSSSATGNAKVAGAPGGLQSVPGGQLTPEYYRALVQANSQAAKQAQMTGGSAVPTLLNEPGAQPDFPQTSTNCTIVCPGDNDANVENDINDLVKSGKLSAEEGKQLVDLAKQNVAVNEYAAHLDQLVKQGKISPEQARKLLDTYRKQHENALASESGKAMDALIKSGQLSVDTANELLDLQKKHASPDEYAAKLKQLVDEGKISPQTANQLLAQYTQQHAKEAAAQAIGQLAQMAASGQISPDVAKELADYQRRHVSPKEYEEELQHLVKQGKLKPEQAEQLLAQYKQLVPPDVAEKLADMQKRNIPIDEYEAELQRQVAAGKLTPEQAQKLLEQYRGVQAPGARASAMDQIVKQAEKANEDAVRELAATGKITPETAQRLMEMQKSGMPVEEYKRHIEELVREGKITPEDAQRLIMGYMQQRGGGVQDLLSTGRISKETAQSLTELQRNNVPVEEYKRRLDEMVRQGKISAEDAQRLLNNYTQMRGAGVQDLLAAGKISPDTAQKLTDLQKANVPIEDYKQQLDGLVREGKISPEDAQKLLQNYAQMRGGGVQDLLAAGKISADTAQKLTKLQHDNAPVEEYKKQLDQLVKEGKISPEDARKLLKNYQVMKGAGVVEELASTGKIPPDVEQKLVQMQRDNVPVAEYKHQLDELVKAGKISPEEAQQLLDKYQKLHAVKEQAKHLATLRANKVPVDEYAKALQKAVEAGTLTPEQANQLLDEYKVSQSRQAASNIPQVAVPNVKGATEFEELQKKVRAATPIVASPQPAKAPSTQQTAQFSAAAAKARAQAEQMERERIQALVSTMSQQAGQLISSWQPPIMAGQVGAADKDTTKPEAKSVSGSTKDGKASNATDTASGEPPLIKAGTIVYAVLDTAVNSDYPDSPVMATIVDGKFKGAKLLGKLTLAQGQDKVSLTFKLMNMEDWMSGKTVNAFAIDPDTARTVLATDVNNHYFMRYGSLFASSFISGYASAIKSSGGTTTTGIFGTSTVNPALSPTEKLMTGIGQVGTTLGTSVQGYVNTPPTVKIDPGVSLGILFMADVTG